MAKKVKTKKTRSKTKRSKSARARRIASPYKLFPTADPKIFLKCYYNPFTGMYDVVKEALSVNEEASLREKSRPFD